MPPTERARRLSRALQARFRIDLFSALVERDFERQLAEVILAAEREAFRRGQDAALGRSPAPSRVAADALPVTPPWPTASADAANSTTA
ncbi:hypothetical protein [Azospirillum doebereinerae]|uniref:Uncharacterized protein n=1 Tax=Azospirillum doebereinerae TaxID=92933 RepID=A0A433JB27_9PROT|nr:hypothetical protein [Azospirillum doebereinerae]MCG5242021.1 hypothetical protein [Azospirillum doebereinerae]RUQ73613.1 hypothetical protein EJ913_08045 [Azospirillum doebereinerae]